MAQDIVSVDPGEHAAAAEAQQVRPGRRYDGIFNSDSMSISLDFAVEESAVLSANLN